MKPSPTELKKLFKEIVSWVRAQDCKVYCYRKKKTVNGSNGYFSAAPYPHIKLGLLGRSAKNSIILLIHEFCHYWQWKSGFLGHRDDHGNTIYSRLLAGEKVSPEERDLARKLVAYSEYDCERRTAFLLKKWNLEEVCPVREHIKSANTYNRHVAWSIGDKKHPGSGIFFAEYDGLADQLWEHETIHWLTDRQIVSPINQQHAEIFDTALAKKQAKKQK